MTMPTSAEPSNEAKAAVVPDDLRNSRPVRGAEDLAAEVCTTADTLAGDYISATRELKLPAGQPVSLPNRASYGTTGRSTRGHRHAPTGPVANVLVGTPIGIFDSLRDSMGNGNHS
jgi:hypothetical protein